MASYFRERRKAEIPQDKQARDFLLAIDQQTKIDVDQRFGFIINQDWHCNTIANCTVEAIISAMNADMKMYGAPTARINFYDLFIAKVTTKVNENAEKEGNINVSFEPGPTANNLITTEVPKNEENVDKCDPKEYFKIEDVDINADQLAAMNEAYLNIDRKARYTLSNNYAITITDDNALCAFAVTYLFILNIFRKLLQDLGDDPTKHLVSVNFNDNIEFHAMRDDEGYVKLAMRPGLNAKLLIKSDETTEDDEFDDVSSWLNS